MNASLDQPLHCCVKSGSWHVLKVCILDNVLHCCVISSSWHALKVCLRSTSYWVGHIAKPQVCSVA